MDSLQRLPELLLPAGGFDSGIAAFEGGADAIYLGFTDFSARKQARNFDRLEYRRILNLAREKGKKIYVALNTLVADAEYPEVAELLIFLERFLPDAIIFQDWAMASFIRERFPSLALHASTQTAIQSPEAAALAASLGVSRVVLPRECGRDDLERFAREAPQVEYEVFVHGALCYSFSGLCLASGLILGRSGNRGECAQVCRSYYTRQNGDKGYWFSCRDLELVDELAALAEAGAASLKVEGRMKSPEYVYSVARLYRAGLDRLKGVAISDAAIEGLKEEAHTAFARVPSKAYFFSASGDGLIDSSYPGHRGVPLGQVEALEGGRATLTLEADLGLRDGVLCLKPLACAMSEALAFSVQDFAEAAGGKRIVTAVAGARVSFAVPDKIEKGDLLRKISSRELDRRLPAPELYPPALEVVEAALGIEACDGGGRFRLEMKPAKASSHVGIADRPLAFVDSEVLPLSVARTPGGFTRALSLFDESGEADFRLHVSLESSTVDVDGQAFPLADLFVPPSLMKKAKNRLYEAISAAFDLSAAEGSAAALSETLSRFEAKAREGEAASHGAVGLSHNAVGFEVRYAPPRAALSFPREGLASGLPYASPAALATAEALPEAAGWRWLPLMPVVSDLSGYEGLLAARLKREFESGAKVMVGLDALHHLPIALRLAQLSPSPDRIGFFGDIHLYARSWPSVAFWRGLFPGLSFFYEAVEDLGEDDKPEREGSCLVATGEGFVPPLFISRGCFFKHDVKSGSCGKDCPKRLIETLNDRNRRYVVVVEDCVTMLFSEDRRSQPSGQALH
jgi:putative protease